MFLRIFRRNPEKRRAQALYAEMVARARQPALYKEMGVPDTFDGRFEMIVMHVAVFITALRAKADETTDKSTQKQIENIAQGLFDAMFKDMDLSIREMGVGDLGVPKHMRRMMTGFNGRLHQYAAAFDDGGRDAMATAIRRNVYGTLADKAVKPAKLSKMVDYALGFRHAMEIMSLDDLVTMADSGDKKAA